MTGVAGDYGGGKGLSVRTPRVLVVSQLTQHGQFNTSFRLTDLCQDWQNTHWPPVMRTALPPARV